MTPDLIAQVLALPLPVRLALLDADPDGAGWMVYPEDADTQPSGDVHQRRHDDGSRRLVVGGAAFLPCNPLAIRRHAIALNWKWLRESAPGDDGPNQERVIELARAALQPNATSEDDYTAALALLREVVGG